MNTFTCWWKNIKLQNKAIKVSEKGKKIYTQMDDDLEIMQSCEKRMVLFFILWKHLFYTCRSSRSLHLTHYHHTTLSKQYSQFVWNGSHSYLITTLRQKHMQDWDYYADCHLPKLLQQKMKSPLREQHFVVWDKEFDYKYSNSRNA